MRQQSEVGSTANKYEILAKLATGGMAEIFLARGVGSVGVARYVVLKRILRELATDKSFVRMFLDEARLVAQLQHPNIAQVHDVGQLGDSYFFTMEYVHGETVRALLSSSRKKARELPLSAVLTIVARAAAGLHHAHEKLSLDGKPLGIVHRDVTPSNIMISFEGYVKVVDFGVAKTGDRTGETKSGMIKGKTNYLSPEQCRGARLDRRSDLFSLGIVMWEMLTCERLYRKGNELEAMSAIVNEDAPPPSKLRANVPPEIDALVGKLLSRDPDKRFATAQEVIDTVEDAAVNTRSKLSASVLVRVLLETFGHRPEPWIILEQQKSFAPTVTVTAGVDDSKVVQLDELPGLELVDERGKRMGTESESGALPVSALGLDDDLAIPRAPVLPAPAADADDSAPMMPMEDLPTSRWSLTTPFVPASTGLDPEPKPTAKPATKTPTGRSTRLRTPIAGVPIAEGSGTMPSPPNAVADGSSSRTPVAPPSRSKRPSVDDEWGEEPDDQPTPVRDAPPPPPPAIARTRTPVPPPPPPKPKLLDAETVRVDPSTVTDDTETLQQQRRMDLEELRVEPAALVVLSNRTHGESAPTETTVLLPVEDGPTTIEPQREMRDATPSVPTVSPMPFQATVAPSHAEFDDDEYAPATSPIQRLIRDPKLLVSIGALLLVVVILLVVIATRGAKTAGVAPQIDAGVVVRAAPDATEIDEPEVVDAAIAATVVVDAGVPRVDAAVVVRPDAGTTRPPPPRPKWNAADMKKLYETSKYATLVSNCSAGAAAVDPAICVLGACRTNNAALAKRWYASTPQKQRAVLLRSCITMGVPLDGRSATPRPE